MRRHRFMVVLLNIGVGFSFVWPLHAQSREGLTDFRGQTYSVDDVEKALFPDAQPPARLRGIARQQRPEPVPEPTVIVDVLFEFNSDRILPRYYSNLDIVGQAFIAPQRSNSDRRPHG